MKYVVIRNKKSDALTLHSSVCTVAVKHYGTFVDKAAYDTREEAIADNEFHGTKIKICNCAKETK